MKLEDGFKIIAIIVASAIAVVLYSVYKFFVPLYFGLTLISIIVLFSVALILMMRIAKDSFTKLEMLSSSLETWIKNEDIRRDLEILPFFVEEKKKEYYKGLRRGYSEIDKLHSVIEDLKERVKELSDQILVGDISTLEDRTKNINELVQSVNIKITNLKLRNSKKKISYDILRLRLR